MGALQPADLLRTLATQSRAGYLMTVDPARARTAPGGLSRDVVERARRGADRSRRRSAAASSSPARRRCRAWRWPCCGRSSTATVEPLLVGDDAAAALLEAYGTAPAQAARVTRAVSLRDAAERIALAIATRPRAAACSRCAANRGCGSASKAAPRPKKSSCRRAPSGSRTASRTAVSSPRRARHGRRHLQRTERAADAARAARSHRVRHRQRRHRRLQDRARPDRRGAPARFRPGAADGDRRRRRARPDRLPRRIDPDHRPRPRRRARRPRLLRDRDGRRACATRATASSRAGRTARWSPPTATSCAATPARRSRSARAPSPSSPTARCAPAASSPASSRSSTSATTSACGARKRGRFRAEAGSTPADAPATSRVRGGALESSNVQLPERMVQLTEVSRAFEALQRGITTLMNDVDGRAISELGRR